jgi:signal peptidase I
MQPTLLPGDILFADKRYNRPGFKQAVQRGDIAIFVYPNDRTTYYIKRIVGLPGDVVDVDGGQLTVPAGEVYVMGDNRTASKDSRNFGTVPLQDVVGKARQLWFSSDKGTIRWERLGKVVE